jgi:hypothetical protein
MSTQKHLLILAILVLAAAALEAQGTATLVRQRQGISFAEPFRPDTAKGETKIIGQVIDVRQMPVAHAKVQLRSLISGKVQQQSESNENGEYSFIVDDPGTYVVEMMTLDGYVIALSNAGSLLRDETLQTVVQLPGLWQGAKRGIVMQPHVSSFFGMSSGTTMTARTVQIALQQSIQPVDAGEPVSPFRP